jgi:hypothetical protein
MLNIKYSIIGVVMSNEVFNMIGMSARRDKNIVNALLWIYYLTRLYLKFGKNTYFSFKCLAYFDRDMIAAVCFHMVCSD